MFTRICVGLVFVFFVITFMMGCANAGEMKMMAEKVDDVVMIDNGYIELVISPSQGGVVRSLKLKSNDFETTSWRASKEVKGGLCSDTTSKMGIPSKFASQGYELEMLQRGSDKTVARCTYRVAEGQLKGLVLRKDYIIHGSDPFFRVKVTLRNEGQEEIGLGYRSHNMLWPDVGRDTLLLLPTERGTMRRMDNADYLVKDLSAGWIAGVDSINNRGMVCAFDKDQVSGAFSWVGDDPTAEWIYRDVKLAVGGQWSTEILYVPFAGLGYVNIVNEKLLGHLKLTKTRQRDVVFQAYGLADGQVTVQPVLLDAAGKEVGRLEAKTLKISKGDVGRLEWKGGGAGSGAESVNLLIDGAIALKPGVSVKPKQGANNINQPKMSKEFESYIENLLLSTEAKCIVSDDREEWGKAKAGILRGFERMMAKDLPRDWPDLNSRIESVLQRKDFRIEQVSAEFWPGVRYGVQVFVPKGEGPFPAVIVVTTAREGGRHPFYQQLEAGLAELGIMAVGIAPIGKGTRDTEEDAYGYNEIALLVGTSIRQEQENIALRTLDYLLTRDDVDPSRIGITGGSDGGLLSLSASTIDSRITAVVPACITWTYCKWLLPSMWKSDDAAEAGSPGLLTYRANVPTMVACNAPKWQRFINVAGETHLRDQRPIINTAAAKAYGYADASQRYSSSVVDCEHGYWPELKADSVPWFYEVFFGNEPDAKVSAGPKLQENKFAQLLLIDGEPVDVVPAGSEEFERMKFADFEEDGGKKAFLPIIETRRKDARSYRAEMLKEPVRLRKELKECLGINALELAPSAQVEGDKVVIETEPGLHISAEWVEKNEVKSKNVLLVVGRSFERWGYDGGDSTRLDLQIRQEGAIGKDLSALVLLNRPPLGMWVWDCLSAASWLRQEGYTEIELVGVGESGAIIAMLAGLLSDDIDRVETVNGTMESLDRDVVGKQPRLTPYWAFRLLWVTDLPEAAELLKKTGKMK